LLLLGASLLVLSAVRAVLLGAGLPAIPVGAGYAMALGALAWVGWTPASGSKSWPPGRGVALAVGAVVGGALLLPGAWLAARGHPIRGAIAPAAAYPAWAAAITAVAVAEEMVLRGALQPLARRAVGAGGAIVLTAALFALIHLPLYGPVALPLDLGVGLVLGVLRQRTGSVPACALAHVIADLGAWWVA
jgi:membrane protease YdiL (CAAX protease family)